MAVDGDVHPRLLQDGAQVERCYDVEAAEALLLGHEGMAGQPRSLPAAWARLHGLPVPPDPPAASREAGPGAVAVRGRAGAAAGGVDPLTALLEVYADQLRAYGGGRTPGADAAADGRRVGGDARRGGDGAYGLPWRADVHRELLHELLGERYAGGGQPRRLAELADEVSAAFGAERGCGPICPRMC